MLRCIALVGWGCCVAYDLYKGYCQDTDDHKCIPFAKTQVARRTVSHIVSASAFNIIGGLQLSNDPFLQATLRTVAHGAVGGIFTLIRGADFSDGFAPTALTALGSQCIDHVGSPVVRVGLAAAVGASVQYLRGYPREGIWSGALLGAMSRLLNDEYHCDHGWNSDSYRYDYLDEDDPATNHG